MTQAVLFTLALSCLIFIKLGSSHHGDQGMNHGDQDHREPSMTRERRDINSKNDNSSGFIVLQSESFPMRVKRAIDKTTIGFTESEKKIIIDTHNAERRNSGASDMMILKWDSALENFAQAWANKCNFDHQTTEARTNFASFSYVGENLAASTDPSGYPAGFVKSWDSEKSAYNYDTGACSKDCGHYTQDVWATTRFVGCGIKYCDPLTGNAWPGYFVVCNYGPGGNNGGQKPYKKGAACSACPSDAKYCIDGLCSTTAGSDSTAVNICLNIYLYCVALSAVVGQVLV